MMDQPQTKTQTIEDLNKLYSEAEDADKEAFAEMRSNVLLISGEHYARKGSQFYNRIRDTKDISKETKLRLTKNHMQKIQKIYANNILTYAPTVECTPQIDSELQDQKSAELHQAIWAYAKEKYDLDDERDDWVDSFTGIGEVWCLIYWDPNAGGVKAYQQKLNEMGEALYTGKDGKETTQMMDESGMMLEAAKGEPVFTGDFVLKEYHGFNVLRAPEAKSIKKSPYIILREMVDIKDAQAMIAADDPEREKKLKMLQTSHDKTFIVFDGKTGYKQAQNQVLFKNYYFRPCVAYPRGFYKITTEHGILFEGELPFGVWPIASAAFDKASTDPRGRGVPKALRPFQAELNRAASKIAEHQITLGDDKIIMLNGSKMTPGSALPGVRGVNVTGAPPIVLPGRDGSQYLEYMNSQITEMYNVAMVAEDSEEKNNQLDPYTLLYAAAKQRKRFSRYVRRFGSFQRQVCKIFLELAKNYYPDDVVIPAIGRREAVNISEFRNSDDLCYQIKIVESTDDIETKLGKQLTLNQIIQYIGNQLDPEMIGQLLRAMPYGNTEEGLSDLTLNYDIARNDILSLDRGEPPVIRPRDDHKYLLKKLTARTRQADFRTLPPNVQQNYEYKIAQHEQGMAQELAQLQAAKDGFIPVGGAMVACDIYVNDSADPAKAPKRARVPYQALEWLLQKLETQGMSLERLEEMNQGNLAEISQILLASKQGGSSAPPQNGAGQPQGEQYEPRQPNFNQYGTSGAGYQ